MSTDLLQSDVFWHAVLTGLLITVSLTVLSMIIGFVLGTIIALAQLYGGPVLRLSAIAYVFVFRAVPLLILLFLVYYGLPRLPGIRDTWFWDLILVSPFATAAFVLTLSNAGYLAEVIRGAILTVPAGLIEAGNAVGMRPARAFFRITLPIAFRNMISTLGNETIAVIKASAITSVITVRDLMGGPAKVGAVYLDPFTPLFVVAIFYILLVQLVEHGVRGLNTRFDMPEPMDDTRKDNLNGARKWTRAILR